MAGKPLREVMGTLHDRFWTKVTKTDGCWLWTGGKNDAGYGRFDVNGKQVPAHRYAYESVHGPQPAGAVIDHIDCYTPGCVRPDHLRPATRKQNGENRSGLSSNNTSGHRGVHLDKKTGKWVTAVRHYGKTYTAGKFVDKEDAVAAVTNLRNTLHTHNELDR